jgi:heme exporter protein C
MASAAGARGASGSWQQTLLVIAALLFITDLFLIFLYAPTASEALGVQVQRIFYFHVPSALLGMVSFAVSAVASVLYLRSRKPRWDRIAWSSAEVGTIFFTVAIVTGAIWAKPVWQTWWVWDANGTLTFMLWLVFIGYLMVRAYAPAVERGSRWAAVVAIIGAAAVPFVYMAADWWSGLHTERVTGPGAEGSLEGRMFVVFMYSLVTLAVLFAALVAQGVAQRETEAELGELRRQMAGAR